MIKYKWYRAFKVLIGYRSFKKEWHNQKTYILIKGPDANDAIEKWLEDGYVEEWPIQRGNDGNPTKAA